MKNVDDDAADVELKKGLTLALCNLDAYLSKSGKYLAGSELSIADCFLLPKLYHMREVAGHFKGYEVPEQFEALEQYMYAGSDLMYAVAPTPAMVRWGWSVARGEPDSVVAAMAQAALE